MAAATIPGESLLQAVWQVATLADYNTRLVVLSTALLGVACGLIGSYLLLRKRSLMGDALSHACLPGVALAFLASVAFGGSGKELPILLGGAALTGVVGFLVMLFVTRQTRIKDDAAMGIVLSVFFGAGVALLAFVQESPKGSAAGLESFIYGKAASMVAGDFLILAVVAGISVALAIALFKELRLLCFDAGYARSSGWPTGLLDVLLLSLVAAVTVAGLQSVGLILIIAFLITPAAAARFWTENLAVMLPVAALIGGLSGWLGSSISALATGLPAGAIIVLATSAFFLFSMLFGTSRGVLILLLRQWQLRRKIGRQHVLRAIYEILERRARKFGTPLQQTVAPFPKVLRQRSWKPRRLRRLVRSAHADDLVVHPEDEMIELTEAGFREAERVTHNHRLWEMYLIRYADIAPSHVDRDADAVEHVVGSDLVKELEQALVEERRAAIAMPESPHYIPYPDEQEVPQ